MSTVAWSIVLATLLVSVAVTGWVRRQALRRQWLDVPNARSSHDAPTPRGGGLGIVVATVCGFVALWGTGVIPGDLCVALLGGGLAVAVTGFRDDRKPLGAGLRLAVHMGAAAWALAWLGGVPPMQVGASTYDLGLVGNLLGALAIGWTINLFNFMDGIDGLAAGEAVFIAGAGALLVFRCGVRRSAGREPGARRGGARVSRLELAPGPDLHGRRRQRLPRFRHRSACARGHAPVAGAGLRLAGARRRVLRGRDRHAREAHGQGRARPRGASQPRLPVACACLG